jgi:hypothetical protein
LFVGLRFKAVAVVMTTLAMGGAFVDVGANASVDFELRE